MAHQPQERDQDNATVAGGGRPENRSNEQIKLTDQSEAQNCRRSARLMTRGQLDEESAQSQEVTMGTSRNDDIASQLTSTSFGSTNGEELSKRYLELKKLRLKHTGRLGSLHKLEIGIKHQLKSTRITVKLNGNDLVSENLRETLFEKLEQLGKETREQAMNLMIETLKRDIATLEKEIINLERNPEDAEAEPKAKEKFKEKAAHLKSTQEKTVEIRKRELIESAEEFERKRQARRDGENAGTPGTVASSTPRTETPRQAERQPLRASTPPTRNETTSIQTPNQRIGRLHQARPPPPHRPTRQAERHNQQYRQQQRSQDDRGQNGRPVLPQPNQQRQQQPQVQQMEQQRWQTQMHDYTREMQQWHGPTQQWQQTPTNQQMYQSHPAHVTLGHIGQHQWNHELPVEEQQRHWHQMAINQHMQQQQMVGTYPQWNQHQVEWQPTYGQHQQQQTQQLQDQQQELRNMMRALTENVNRMQNDMTENVTRIQNDIRAISRPTSPQGSTQGQQDNQSNQPGRWTRGNQRQELHPQRRAANQSASQTRYANTTTYTNQGQTAQTNVLA